MTRPTNPRPTASTTPAAASAEPRLRLRMRWQLTNSGLSARWITAA